ncbi:MAG: hypothetical protein HC822_10465 [Oscillochloris sp.]|nr:hypothetical protein [Oscillochloris sp.]
MNDRTRIPFIFPGRGRVELTIGRCRRLCPAETTALLEAANQVRSAPDEATRREAAAHFAACLHTLQAALPQAARRLLEGG